MGNGSSNLNTERTLVTGLMSEWKVAAGDQTVLSNCVTHKPSECCSLPGSRGYVLLLLVAKWELPWCLPMELSFYRCWGAAFLLY